MCDPCDPDSRKASKLSRFGNDSLPVKLLPFYYKAHNAKGTNTRRSKDFRKATISENNKLKKTYDKYLEETP